MNAVKETVVARFVAGGAGLFIGGLLATTLETSGAARQDVEPAGSGQLPPTIQFSRDIRPILSDNCLACHGPDGTQRTTVFRFDIEESAKQALPGGRFVILPGDPERSLLIQRITAEDPARRMPPAATGRTLSAREIALLKAWIQQGATWERHWAFIPPARPPVPSATDPSWVRNPIDNFVLHRLEQEGLRPAPEPDRETLLRRVTLDLIGKGPTLAEQDAFLADLSPNAYEKVVDRLLRSPRYGERMALPWLDAARYSDTNGYQQDIERFMWRWRDWVIEAFNKNTPYDQFTIEQLAGDLLANATLDQKIATGFNRNHRTNSEGGIIPAEFAAEYVVDRVATTSTVFLGLTAGCARCHDHKYDPLSQKEFYRLFAFFNNVPEKGLGGPYNSVPYIKAPLPDQQAELKKFDDRIAAASARVAALQPEIAAAEAAWLRSLAGGPPTPWAPSRGLIAHYPLDGGLGDARRLVPAGASAPEKPPEAVWRGTPQFAAGIMGQAAGFDGTSFVDAGNVGDFGDAPLGERAERDLTLAADKFALSAWIYPTAGTGAILSKAVDRPQEKGYVLQLNDGKVQMRISSHENSYSALVVETEEPIALNRWHHVLASYGGEREARSMTLFVDGEAPRVKTLSDSLTFSQSVSEPLRFGAGGGPASRFRGLIDDVRLYAVELTAEEARMLSVSRPLNELAATAPRQRTNAEADKVRGAFLESPSLPAHIRAAVQQLRDLRAQRATYLADVTTTMVMEDLPTPRETHVLLRGAYDAPGEIVTPDVPAFLPPMRKEHPKNRLGFAQWLVDPSNPLTARVAVNRFWHIYFGIGIVKDVDNFGAQGEPPSHPELLDWLATEFVRTGWDVKALQKLIVMSATYRQSSNVTQALLQRDPENRLLARGARFRLPAETVRDQALAASGLLVEELGGPSVKPYQPEGLWSELTGAQRYDQDHGDNLYRRSLYTFWKRTITPPSMANFDAPTREASVVHRGITNTPLQALDLMNNVTYLEAARVLGQRMLKAGGSTPQQRIVFAFRLATGRHPTQNEERLLSGALDRALNRFRAQPAAVAGTFLAVGEFPRDENLDARELAAYASVASLILNLDKTIAKD
jgi:hypothetical protein